MKKTKNGQHTRQGLAISGRTILLPRSLWDLVDHEAELPGREYRTMGEGLHPSDSDYYVVNEHACDTASDVMQRALEAYFKKEERK
jgi:hypothetical protein